ncbi:hypothetical protein A2382_02305 [Candidatus Woesebacteria bacterium RIFOXYB1_FULL_38_16]|uniref:Uncharacterized protein n=1 Tax=Candidatus Woesebacteria bacterium RIFOXYB1_FULL_38_16 TaxID=1802538 RepID=A0A1F8CRH5_9BACT|nr:MAG: hypothetical protein A2191_04470 [Candidatus Woesebacteria bacterium RIFOXYA1_FULL_38_9]OGM78861.1 MAG: hypothetical protein A2382_02305 [Candidatus Woesebacteria bacterium RIFOXYB1_FULL_38_16]
MNKILIVFTVVAVVLGMIPMTVFAQEDIPFTHIIVPFDGSGEAVVFASLDCDYVPVEGGGNLFLNSGQEVVVVDPNVGQCGPDGWTSHIMYPVDAYVYTNDLQPISTPEPEVKPEPVVEPTPVGAVVTQLPEPPENPADLPTSLDGLIGYQQAPGDNCWEVNDPQVTCSTLEGQETHGVFTLEPGSARVMTGDRLHHLYATPVVADFPQNVLFDNELGHYTEVMDSLGGSVNWVYPRLNNTSGFETDVVVLANASAAPVQVGVAAEHGSWRGNFYLPPGMPWGEEQLVNLRDLHISKMLVVNEEAAAAWAENRPEGIYPDINPANCSAVADLSTGEVTFCGLVNVYVVVWDGTNWNIVSYGVYNKFLGGWVDYSNLVSD